MKPIFNQVFIHGRWAKNAESGHRSSMSFAPWNTVSATAVFRSISLVASHTHSVFLINSASLAKKVKLSHTCNTKRKGEVQMQRTKYRICKNRVAMGNDWKKRCKDTSDLCWDVTCNATERRASWQDVAHLSSNNWMMQPRHTCVLWSPKCS